MLFVGISLLLGMGCMLLFVFVFELLKWFWVVFIIGVSLNVCILLLVDKINFFRSDL